MSKVIVFIHGAGEHKKDYYVETLAGLTELLGARPEAVGVWYSDLLNEKEAAKHKKAGHLDGSEVENFKAAFSMLVHGDFNALPHHERHNAAFIMPAQFLAEMIATDLQQFAEYLFSSKTYNALQTRMRDGLNKALGLGDELVIAGHSLGSVVAFDCLRETAGNSNVTTFLTLGSPLSKLRRLNIRTSDLGAIPGNIGEWLNLYDTTDPIANALGPMFPSRPFRLRDVFVDVEDDPIRSHDYFHNEQTLAELAGAML
jgi:pimeloyl-ACP methyl ester carboxylesterase